MGKMGAVVAVGVSVVLLALAGCSAKAASDPASTGQPQAGAATTGAGGAAAARPAVGAQATGQAGARRFATIQVQAVAVKVGPLVTDNDTAGTVVPSTQSQVAAQTTGVVSRILHKPGDWVNAGDIVVQLDDAVLKIAVQNAQAILENARINLEVAQQNNTASSPKLQDQLRSAQNAQSAAQKNYDSQKKLFDLGGISSSQLDSAKSQLDTANANVSAAQTALDQNSQAGTQSLAQLKLTADQASNQLQLARLNLQNAAIKAPFAGQIAAINVSQGMFVGQNTAVFLLVSVERQINFSEPPSDAPNFAIGSTVRFVFGGQGYPVQVTQTPGAPVNGVVPMVASVPTALNLPYGTVGTVSYSMTLATGAQIPVAALESRADENYVYVIVDGKAAEQAVTVLAESGTTAVVAGLDAGAQVIVNAPPGLLVGSVVQAVGSAAGTGQRQQQGGGTTQGQAGAQRASGTQGQTGGQGATGTQGGGTQRTSAGGSQPAQTGQGGQQ